MESQEVVKIFNSKNIRTVWKKEEEKYYFSVVDVIGVLSESDRPRKYWSDLKTKLQIEGSQLSENIGRFKMKAEDGKMRFTDVCDTEQLLRIIQSVPSKNAEPFKLWLAKVGNERIDETFDPELAIHRALETYRKKGYSDEWINLRLKSIEVRHDLTENWRYRGVRSGKEYAILTNEIYKAWADMNAREYKDYKGLKKESLRDNMTNIELILNMLAEESTSKLAEKKSPFGLDENKEVAKTGGGVAKKARVELEEKLDESVISSNNNKNISIVSK